MSIVRMTAEECASFLVEILKIGLEDLRRRLDKKYFLRDNVLMLYYIAGFIFSVSAFHIISLSLFSLI